MMDDEIQAERVKKRRKIAERHRLEKQKADELKTKSNRAELFIKIGVLSILAMIPVDFTVVVYPVLWGTMSMELQSVLYILIQGLAILFGLGMFYAGRRMSRDSGVYGGVIQLDSAVISIVGILIFLIVNPLYYTQEYLIVSSLYSGLNTIISFTTLGFSILISFFFLLVGTNSQRQSLKYPVAITGILWLAQLFIPVFRPSPTQDLTLYIGISAFTWVVYGLTAYCLWKILYDYEGVSPLQAAAFKLK
jgi:hypothetical protein